MEPGTVAAPKKPLAHSWTLWAAAVTAVLPLVPGIGPALAAWTAQNPELYSAILGVAFGALRLKTDQPVR